MTARAMRSLQRGDFWWRFGRYNAGVALLGLGLALMLDAHIGLGPWAVFHQGVSLVTGLSFGRVLQLTGIVVVALGWWLAGYRPGPGTLGNMLLVGLWVDVFLASGWLPEAHGLVAGVPLFLAGTVVSGLASGLYIASNFGAGPRDGLVIGLARRLPISVGAARTGLELLVLALGFVLGGSVGLGTLLFAFLIGPLMQFFLRLFGDERRG